jgi:hypothetical protein
MNLRHEGRWSLTPLDYWTSMSEKAVQLPMALIWMLIKV